MTPTTIKISELNQLTEISSSDFFPLVHSSSLTTFRTDIFDLNRWMTASGSSLSASYAPYSQYWGTSGSNIFNLNTKYVGINNENPQVQLDVSGTLNANFCNVNGLYIQKQGLTNTSFTADTPPGALVINMDTTSSTLPHYDIPFPPKFGDGIYMSSNNNTSLLNSAANFGMFLKNKNFSSSYIPSNNDYAEGVGLYMFGFYGGNEGISNDVPIYIGGNLGGQWNGITMGQHPVTLTISRSLVGISNTSPIYTLDVNGTGNFTSNVLVTGSITTSINNAIGFFGTASYAISSSHALTSSYATSASYAKTGIVFLDIPVVVAYYEQVQYNNANFNLYSTNNVFPPASSNYSYATYVSNSSPISGNFNITTAGIPVNISGLILSAYSYEGGPNGDNQWSYITIQKNNTSFAHLLLTGCAAGGGDAVTSNNQGVYPVNSDGTFIWNKTNYSMDTGWIFGIIGYYK